MFQMRFHKQSSSNWLLCVSVYIKRQCENLCVCVCVVCTYALSIIDTSLSATPLTIHIYTMCHSCVAMALIKKIRMEYSISLNYNCLFMCVVMGRIVLIERTRKTAKTTQCIMKHHAEWLVCWYVCCACSCKCVCVCVFLATEWEKRHLSECIQCNRKTLCDIDWEQTSR